MLQIYINMRQVIISIHKNEGLSAYYRGLFPTLIQNSLQGGLSLCSITHFQNYFLQTLALKKVYYFNHK